ncbi:transglycosylase domain-containing protein [Candidatus Giovannonibacteria bacterium]|nr:transglycosylase domain-containing protein [Candidatus Giovannonibacteria bacterium]
MLAKLRKNYKKIIAWGAGAVFLVFALFLIIYINISLPDFSAFENRLIVESTKIYDRTGKVLLYDIHSDIKRTVVPFDSIPRNLKNATIAIEDADFYKHRGISFLSIVRAFLVDLLSGRLKQGGSTITQQLVKKALLTDERTFTRKIKEIVLAFKVEANYSKDEILGLYLNEIPYGYSNYGIEAASQNYFGKRAAELTLAESAYLAAIPKAPTYYSPFGNHMDALEARKNLVLERMKALEFISADEYEAAKNEIVSFQSRSLGGIKAPHFIFYLKDYLVEKYGEDAVETGGLQVISTLNWDWQQKAEKLVQEFGETNQINYNAWNEGLVALDPKTGQVLVMVGSRDYQAKPLPEGCTPGKNCKFDPQVNVTVRSRQPGSSIKPVVYATAFNKGFTPNTVLFDLPTEFNPACSPDGVTYGRVSQLACYHPRNFDGRFRGPVTMKSALAQSLNLPSVKTLYLAGIEDSIDTAEKIGITTLKDPSRIGLSLVLGGGEVKLLELAGAYNVFANDGIFHPETAILEIKDSSGKVLEKYEDRGRRVFDPNIARQITDILTDNNARAPIFGSNSPLNIAERPVAVKTGTTNDFKDGWVLSYMPNLTVGIWMGNSDNTTMGSKAAGVIVTPMWNAFLKEMFKELPREDFKPPAPTYPPKPALRGEWKGGRVYKIDKISGKLATEFTPEELVEEKIIPEVHSILYWVDPRNPTAPSPINPGEDPQFRNWEAKVRSWAFAQGYYDAGEGIIPSETDNSHLPEMAPVVKIDEPLEDHYPPNTKISFVLSVESKFPIDQVDFFLDNKFLGSVKSSPYSYSVALYGLPGENFNLIANVYDQVRNKTSVSKTITISEN